MMKHTDLPDTIAIFPLTGALLWETTLPAAGNATPSIYMIDGKQYVVIACGGGKNGAPSGSSIVAFALPGSVTEH